MAISVLVVYSHSPVAYWELELTAAAQHHKRVWYLIRLAQERLKTQNLKYGFYRMHIIFTLS